MAKGTYQVKRQTAKRRFKWPLVWLIQAVAALLLGALTALSMWLGKTVHGIFLWGILPLGGMAMGCIATRRGLNNYLAWLAPPLMEVLSSLLVWGYSPSAGPVFLCAFLSLVGAATGEGLKRQNHK